MTPLQVCENPDALIDIARAESTTRLFVERTVVRRTVRLRVRFRGRARGRLGVHLGVLWVFAQLRLLGCSETVFSGGGVCEKSMSVGSCVSVRGSSWGLRLSVLVAGGVLLAPFWWLSVVTVAVGGALLVALLGLVTAGAYVVLADRVVASRRLLLCRARLGRPRLCSAWRYCSATVSRNYTLLPTLSRQKTGRWGRAAGAAARRGGAR